MEHDPHAAYRQQAIVAGFVALAILLVILVLVLAGVLKEVPLGW